MTATDRECSAVLRDRRTGRTILCHRAALANGWCERHQSIATAIAHYAAAPGTVTENTDEEGEAR